MRILFIPHEFPYPMDSGVKCDMGRRLTAFRGLGHPVFVVTWVPSGENISEADRRKLESEVGGLALFTINRTAWDVLRRLAHMIRYPSLVAARIPTGGELRRLEADVAAFGPDLIWVEGIHATWLGLHLHRRLGIPIAYRSHNIEHRYLPEQGRLATTARQKAQIAAASLHLRRYEYRVMGEVNRMFDISNDDLRFWRGKDFTANDYLLPQADPAILATMSHGPGDRDIDLFYVGGLNSPNNIAGLSWYFTQVHPLVKQALPDLRLVIAGHAPTPSIRQLCAQGHAELVPDPPDISGWIGKARVLCNPILHGSGINIKTVDMLASGRPVITTSKGARGLPPDIVAELDVIDDPDAFAQRIIARVIHSRAEDSDTVHRRDLIERHFGTAIVAQALRHFESPATSQGE